MSVILEICFPKRSGAVCKFFVKITFLVIRHLHDIITKTCLFKYTTNFTTKKGKFSNKKFSYFYVDAQNMDYEFSLEPPRRGGSNKYPQTMFWADIRKIMYTPVNPSFTI